MKNKRKFFLNALLLTAVALFMRTVGVTFQVYLAGRAGAEAMGLLSLIGGVYGFAVTLATSGIHLATVRTVAQSEEKNGGAGTGQCLRACLFYALFFGTLATALLFLLAPVLGHYALRDARTVRALRMMSVTLLPIALTSVLNGYFIAVRRAYKNALAQVAEQAIVREIREELATEIRAERKLCTVEYDYPAFHLTMECFLCSIVSGKLTLLEHENAAWLSEEKLESVKWLPADVEVLENLKELF